MSKQNIHHKAGSKLFMKVIVELGAELKKKPTRVDIFRKTHSYRGDSLTGLAAEKLKEMEELETSRMSQEGSSDEECVYGPGDVYFQVMGPDRGGRVRCYGSTVKPKKFYKGESSSFRVKRDAEVVELKKMVGMMGEQLKVALQKISQLEADRGVNNTNTTDDQDMEHDPSSSSLQ